MSDIVSVLSLQGRSRRNALAAARALRRRRSEHEQADLAVEQAAWAQADAHRPPAQRQASESERDAERTRTV